MEALFDPGALVGLGTLIVLEVVLGIDNLVFVAILAGKLPPGQRDRARLIGLSLALITRLGLLASIAWIVGLTEPVFSLFGRGFSWRDIILAGGGLFLLAKATKEIHERLEGDMAHGTAGTGHARFWVVIVQILALDLVFSLDSIITAVGMVQELWIMVTAVVVAMGIMLLASKPLTLFVGRHPTVVILCLSFLLLIGASLVGEGFGVHLPKGYLYAAIGFSIVIELFNQLANRNRRHADTQVPFRQRTADAIQKLLAPDADGGEATEAAIQPAEAFQPVERTMIQGVMALSDTPVRTIMTPRAEIFWLDAAASPAVNQLRLAESGRTRALVCRGGLDGMLGVVETRVALAGMLQGEADMAVLAQRPLVVPDDLTALRLTNVLRETGERFAVVVDGHGNIDGVVSATDIFAAIAGDLAEDDGTTPASPLVQLDPEMVELGPSATLVELDAALGGIGPLPPSRRHTTVAGFVTFELGRLPEAGEVLERSGLRFTVLQSRQNRIERIRVERMDGQEMAATSLAS